MGKKTKYDLKTRKDISNPFHKMTYAEQLKAAGIKPFQKGDYAIETLPNGRIIVKGKGQTERDL